MKKWLPILVLGLTQFDMVLDGTVMNVSITEVVGCQHDTIGRYAAQGVARGSPSLPCIS